MIFPRYSVHHPLSNSYMFGQPHVFLIKPLSHSDKKSSPTRSAGSDSISSNSDQPKKSETGGTVHSNKAVQPTLIYQDRGIHIEDTGDGYRLVVDMPGVKSTDCHVELHEGVLRIEAERKYYNGDASGNARTVSKFAQSFLVADDLIDETKLQATLEDGVLTVAIPKKEEAKPVEIPVISEYPPEEQVEKANDKEGGDGDLRVSIDVPGVRAGDLKLEYRHSKICLHAERKGGGKFSGAIDKEMPIDTQRIDPATFKAYLMDGVLTIAVACKAVVEPKKIAINTTAAAATPMEIEGTNDDAVIVETVPTGTD